MRPRGPNFLLALAMLATFVAYNLYIAPRRRRCLPGRNAGHLAFFEVAGVGYDPADEYIRAVEAVADIQRGAQAYPVGGTTVGLRPAG